MTTAKSRVLIILCLLFSLLLCACQTDTAGLLTLDALNNHSESEPSDAAEQDCVILPTSASEPLIARARAMTNALSRQTGVPASMFFDDEALPTSNNVRLILLGNTSHELSQKHLRKLRRDDYLCAVDGTALVLGGKSDDATITAIDRFCEQLLPYADAKILINQDQAFKVYACYDVEAVTLGGFSFEDFRIVYPKSDKNGERAVALALREAIADRCGFYLDVLPDNRVTEQVRVLGIGACFGNTAAAEAKISITGSVISLGGASQYQLASAAQAFYDFLFPQDAPKHINASLTEAIPISAQEESLSALIGIVDETLADPLPDVVRVQNEIKRAEPLLVPLAAMSDGALQALVFGMSEYSCLSLSLDDTHSLPLLFRKDALTLLSQTNDRLGMTLRFSIRESGQCFTVYHAYVADAEASRNALQAAQQITKDREPSIVLISTPVALHPVTPESNLFCELSATVSTALRTQIFVHLPSELSASALSAPSTAGEPYTVLLPHPFLTHRNKST